RWFVRVMRLTGTVGAGRVHYWRRWGALASARAGADPARPPLSRFIVMVLLATAVTGVFGGGLLLFIERVVLEGMMHRQKGGVEELFKSLPLIGTALLAAGAVILLAGWQERSGEK